MSKIHVITDTDSNLPVELAKNFNIVQVPITIQFGDESFADNIEIQNPALFERIDKTGKLPTTAAPSPAAFSTAFQSAFDRGAESIICVCVGSKISRTYESALVATDEFPTRKITVIDSGYVTLGQAFMAIAAAEALALGATHEEAVDIAKSQIGRQHLFGALSTLKYLALGGRVSNLAASVGNMFNIRPILTMVDGKLDLLEKVRTRKAAMDRMVELIIKSVDDKEIERCGIIHVLNLEDAKILEGQLRSKLKMPDDVLIADFGPGLSVHTGSGFVGIVILTKE
jgi:DegV family protein with EDD domain